MAKKKKKNTQELDTLKPINIYELGGDNDPCFGKQYDLSADECNRCGDSELCAIATAQNLNGIREKIEKETEFKDIQNEVGNKKVENYIKKRIDKGYDLSRIKKLVKKKFRLKSKEIRKLYNTLK